MNILSVLSLFNGIRVLPLWLLLKYKQYVLKDKYATLFYKDIEKYKLGFFKLLYIRPYYKMVLYHRLGFISYPLKPICGTFPLYIPNCEKMSIGGGISLDHPYNTIINAKSVGRNLTVVHLATIGSSGKSKGLPVVGDNVYIGCGACVIGDIKIGNNVKIGANAVIVKDVPNNATVIGNPAYIVKLNSEKVSIKL